jgi:hypothetical protein
MVGYQTAVENFSDFFVGMVVFASINFVKTPPIVSIPKESGVTSNNNTSVTSPRQNASLNSGA